MDYERETKLRYQDNAVAKRYKQAYTGEGKKRGLRERSIRIIASRERACVRSIVSRLNSRCVLDIPFGTGKLADLLLDVNTTLVGADISMQMMQQIDPEIRGHANFLGLVRCDAEVLPFQDATFDCAITLRLMHRVPASMKRKFLKELRRVSRRYLIISFGIISPWQRFRLHLRRLIYPGEVTIPAPITLSELRKELDQQGLQLLSISPVLRFLSSEHVLLLEKNSQGL